MPSIKAKLTMGVTSSAVQTPGKRRQLASNLHDYCIIVNSINCFPISVDFHLIIIKY